MSHPSYHNANLGVSTHNHDGKSDATRHGLTPARRETLEENIHRTDMYGARHWRIIRKLNAYRDLQRLISYHGGHNPSLG